MAVTIEEGRLVELPMPEASDTERRALGEFAGPGGEPASCAIGLTTGAEPHVARMTTGIGAGVARCARAQPSPSSASSRATHARRVG